MYARFPVDAIVVQKYGGTSVGSVERIQAIAKRTKNHVDLGRSRLAIVVSAMSGETNRLVNLVTQTNRKASPKSYDIAVAAGEQVSVGLLCAALEGEGVNPEPLLGYQLGIFTDANHSRARIKSINTDRLHKCWSENRVPVIAGFQGMTPDGNITTLGRGGSDTSAVALAAALQAAFCEINTDVDGFFSADPRIVPNARLIPEMSAEVALELAALGSKVLHSRCVELAEKFRIPLVVRNTFTPDESRRTYVMLMEQLKHIESPVVSGLTLDRNVAKITVNGLPSQGTAISDLFTEVANAGVNVDIIVYDLKEGGRISIGFTVAESDIDATQMAFSAYKARRNLVEASCDVQMGLDKVSAVGLGMRTHSGVAARMLQTLSKNGIEICMISTSEIKISCVVPHPQAERAVQRLHDEFIGMEN